MTWTIAKPKPETTGTVLLSENEAILGDFHEVTFAGIDAPTLADFDSFRTRLPGTRGHFRIDGNVATSLMAAYLEGKPLTLQFVARGASFGVGIVRDGDTLTMRLPDGETEATVFPFRVGLVMYVQATMPGS
jgi:hypothetical protein